MNLVKLFVNSNRWLQNGFAQNQDGSDYPLTRLWGPNYKDPYALSLHGAVACYTESGSQSRDKVMSKLSTAIEKYTGKSLYVAEFNDSPDTTFKDIQAVVNLYNKLN